MSRRFLNLIVENSKTGVKSLHLIDPWKHLFYPSSARKVEAAEVHTENKKRRRGAALMDILKLPKPHLRFGLDSGVKPMHFFSALLKENCLLLADSAQATFLHDVDLKAQMFIPDMNFTKGANCVSFSTPQPNPFYPLDTHCLYVLDLSLATSSLEVLNYFCRNHSSQPRFETHYNSSFYWQDIPPPPPFLCGDTMCASIMVDGSTICISSSSVDKGVGGTYAFAMVTSVWAQVGDRVLPF
ncbi:unnamed protein product [Alopecurus aequalis]